MTENSDRRLLLVQAWSGVVFALFLSVHLANTMLAALGAEAYDGTQQALRKAYQTGVLEIVLVLGPLLVHAGAGVARLWRRRQSGRRAPANLRARLHRWSGVVLLVFFLGHVTATRGASFVFHIFPAFQGISYTLQWMPAYFWPYYTVFSLAGLYHLVHGLGVALPILTSRATWLRRPAVAWPIIGVGACALIAGMAGFGGLLRPIEDPGQGPYAALLVKLGVARRP